MHVGWEWAGWLLAGMGLASAGAAAAVFRLRTQRLRARMVRLAEGLDNLNPRSERLAFLHEALSLLSTAFTPCRVALWLKDGKEWVGYTLSRGGLQETRIPAGASKDEASWLREAGKKAWQQAFAAATRITPVQAGAAYLHVAAASQRHLPGSEELRLVSAILTLPMLHRQDLRRAEQAAQEAHEKQGALNRRISALTQELRAKEEERERLLQETVRLREEAEQQLQRATEELMKAHQEMDALRERFMNDRAAYPSEFSAALDALMDSNFLLELILETAMGETRATIGSIMLLNEETRKLEIKVSRGLRPEVIRSTRIALGEAIAGYVAQEGRPLLIEDIQAEPRLIHATAVRFRKRSFISVPILLGDRVLGVMNLSNKHGGRTFTQEDLRTSEALASRAAAVLEAIPAAGDPVGRLLRKYLTPQMAAQLEGCLQPLDGTETVQTVSLLGVRIHGISKALSFCAPAQVTEALSRWFHSLAQILEAHRGVLDQSGGTWLMGVFGLPFPTEEDALRAVQAGVSMVQERPSHPELEAVLRHLSLTVGVTTGTAVVGPVGPGTHRHHTVAGEVVNQCHRLQLLGIPGQVLMDEGTAQRLDGRAELRSMGSLGNGSVKRVIYAFQRWVGSQKPATTPTSVEDSGDRSGSVPSL